VTYRCDFGVWSSRQDERAPFLIPVASAGSSTLRELGTSKFVGEVTKSGWEPWMRARGKALLWVVAGMALVFTLGAYNKSISSGERGSFVMNYPATGKACGGPSPRALTGAVTIPLDKRGILKRALQPGVIEVASHVVSNVGGVPRRIRFETVGFPPDTEAHSRDRAWNPETQEIERDLAPGASIDFGLLVTLPNPLPAVSVPASGTIYIVDARSGKRLSALPVRFEQSGFAQTGGDCCAP